MDRPSFARPLPLLRHTLFLLTSVSVLPAQTTKQPSPATLPSLLTRHYVEGEKIAYQMRGNNEGWTYEVQAHGIVKKDARGRYIEEYGWSDFKSSTPVTLSPEILSYRQTLSLDPAVQPPMPDLTKVQPFLIGPITDFATFYRHLWLAIHQSDLTKAGDHAYVKFGGPISWADGTRVVVGEDSIDFDLTLKQIDETRHIATLLVRHVPPARPSIMLPAEWMQKPVADTPNNFINVQKTGADKFIAQVGKETFDVEIKVDLRDGRILSATMDNPVQVSKRECSNASLTDCGEAVGHVIHRRIELEQIQP